MTELCINNSYFQFRGKYYQQMSGTAMGSPLSPILADYVMEDLLDVVTKRLNFNIPVLKKYVDDLYIVLPTSEVQNTLMAFNQYEIRPKSPVYGQNGKWWNAPVSGYTRDTKQRPNHDETVVLEAYCFRTSTQFPILPPNIHEDECC